MKSDFLVNVAPISQRVQHGGKAGEEKEEGHLPGKGGQGKSNLIFMEG